MASIDRALTQTIQYMKQRKDGEPKDLGKEYRLTDFWVDAGHAVSGIDDELADACQMKGLGWTDPAMWELADKKGIKTGIEDMIEARKLLKSKRYPTAPLPPSPSSPAHISAGQPVLIITLVLAAIFAAGCIFGGIQMIAAPGSGATVFRFVGLEFTTQQAGVAGIGLGAIVVILVFRRVLKSLDYLGQL